MASFPRDAAPAVTIAALLKSAATTLADASDSARLDAELLLAFALERSRSQLHAWPERTPTQTEAERFRTLVARRRAGAPVAYLTGRCEFFSLPLAVDAAVLIPRPETELIVELALARIPANARLRILDAGTGSGAIALAIAGERPRCRIVASDISSAALAVAKRNAERLAAGRLAFVAGDWLAPFAARSFDLIVSNPPYVPDADPHLEQGDIRAEPRLALAAGIDGLDAIRIIAREAPRCLRPDGWLILEHGYDQREAVADILKRSGFRNLQAARDLGGRARAACGQS
ncbi:MAG TPA: peptide chain release factor N(5)-glutamine methyltransferase [Gammaproteobacteria bacterium]|nr:peptide chain release factor N(5)-glutamine methyltransferase [Gammaproteobacteria bacterium]